MEITWLGLDPDRLAHLRETGTDHNGDPVRSFVDRDGGWPLRCCLTTSRPGDEVAIVAFSPFTWSSPYRTTGPVVVHADRCDGGSGNFPEQLEHRDQVLRAYGNHDGREHALVYDQNRWVAAGSGLAEAVRSILADPRVEMVQGYNPVDGCYSFTAVADSSDARHPQREDGAPGA